MTHLFSRNAQRVVQVFGQVGTLPFDVVRGPGVQAALGHGVLHGRYHVSALLPEASRNDREEGKHYRPNMGQLAHTRSYETLEPTAKQRQTASKYTAKHNTHVNEAG